MRCDPTARPAWPVLAAALLGVARCGGTIGEGGAAGSTTSSTGGTITTSASGTSASGTGGDTGGSGTGNAGTGGDGGAGAGPCDPSAPLAWIEEPPPPAFALHNQAAAVAGQWAYMTSMCAGDGCAQYGHEVLRARAACGQPLGDWQTDPTAKPVYYTHGIAALGGQAILVHGTHPGCFRCFYVAPIEGEGKLGAWTSGAVEDLASDCGGGPCAVGPWGFDATLEVGGKSFVYALGGFWYDGSPALSRTMGSEVQADGSLVGGGAAWKTQGELPVGLMEATVVVRGGSIYVLGGGDTAGFVSDQILRATPDGAGNFGGWEVLGTKLPWAAVAPAAAATSGWLYVAGGLDKWDGSGRPNGAKVSRAPFNGDGTLGPFQALPDASFAPGYGVGAAPSFVLGARWYVVAAHEPKQDAFDPAAFPHRIWSTKLE